jgi:hypothetical protein
LKGALTLTTSEERNIEREIPLDDEPTTQDDLDAIDRANNAYLKGELINLRDVEQDLRK